MRRVLTLCFVALPSLVTPSCFSQNGDAGLLENPGLLTLANCTAEALRDGNEIVEQLGSMMSGVGGPLGPGVAFNPVTGAFAIDTPQGIRIAGTLTTASNLIDGFQVGESADVDFMLAGNGLTGSGAMTFTLEALNRLASSGGFTFTDGDCTFEGSQIALAADPTEATPVFTGTLDFRITNGTGDVLEGAMTADPDEVLVNATFNSSTTLQFMIGLENYSVFF